MFCALDAAVGARNVGPVWFDADEGRIRRGDALAGSLLLLLLLLLMNAASPVVIVCARVLLAGEMDAEWGRVRAVCLSD